MKIKTENAARVSEKNRNQRRVPGGAEPGESMNPQTPRVAIALVLILAAISASSVALNNRVNAQGGQVQVTAADPPSAEQGTVSLNVRVTGKGFKNGAQAKWFVTGTTNPGGVTVNSTTFVSSTELTANITVDDAAVIANFDIQVTNSDGRGGKGTELFSVIAKGGGGGGSNCPAPAPAPTSDTKCYAEMPGCLDSTFAGVGYVHIDPDPYIGSANAAYGVEVQPDGKTVVAGTVRRSNDDIDFTVLRYNVDGTLDTSFGDPDPLNTPLRRGFTMTAITPAFDYLYAMVLQPDGKILVSGRTNESVVVRYNDDGTLDPGFGNGGIAHLGSSSPARALALQADGKIIVGGSAANLFALVRLNSNGSLDSSFGSNGKVSVNPSGAKRGSGVAWGLVIQRVPAFTGEERIILAGWSRLSSGDNSDWTLMRFRSNGATDTSFGSSGIVKTYFSGSGDQARNVKIDSSNRIIVAGIVGTSSNCGWYVENFGIARYTENGSLDGSFSGGTQVVDVYGGTDTLYTLALQADGKVLILGTAYSSDSTVKHFALVRFNADGSRDSSFGLLGNGIVTTELYGAGSYGYALALDPSNGKIVAAGTAYLASGTPGDIAVARYWP